SAARTTVGCRLRAGRVSMARSARSDPLRATATRAYSGDVPAATTSPKCRYASARVRAPPAVAVPDGGPGIPDDPSPVLRSLRPARVRREDASRPAHRSRPAVARPDPGARHVAAGTDLTW